MSQLPPRADVYRRLREQVDADTLDNLGCYLALLDRTIGWGRSEAAKTILDELRAGLRPRRDEHVVAVSPGRDRR